MIEILDPLTWYVAQHLAMIWCVFRQLLATSDQFLSSLTTDVEDGNANM